MGDSIERIKEFKEIKAWLTDCSVEDEEEAEVLVEEPLEPEPWVPDGLMLSLMYPYRPLSSFPQLSSGYPGQASLHCDVSTWFAGA